MRVNIRKFREKLSYYLTLPCVHITSRGKVIAKCVRISSVHNKSKRVHNKSKQVSVHKDTKKDVATVQKKAYIAKYGCGCKKGKALLCPTHQRM